MYYRFSFRDVAPRIDMDNRHLRWPCTAMNTRSVLVQTVLRSLHDARICSTSELQKWADVIRTTTVPAEDIFAVIHQYLDHEDALQRFK